MSACCRGGPVPREQESQERRDTLLPPPTLAEQEKPEDGFGRAPRFVQLIKKYSGTGSCFKTERRDMVELLCSKT